MCTFVEDTLYIFTAGWRFLSESLAELIIFCTL